MGVISQNGIDYPVPSVPVQSDAHATDLINDAVQTGQTLKSYLNSNFVKGSNTWKQHSAAISVPANSRAFVGNFPLEIVSVACTDSRVIPYFSYVGTVIQIYIYNPTSAAISTDVYYR